MVDLEIVLNPALIRVAAGRSLEDVYPENSWLDLKAS
jgi:hypothetical protein